MTILSGRAQALEMANINLLDPDRLFAASASERTLARALYETVEAAPIISPHGHTDPAWFAENAPFANATSLLLLPDHYVLRMLYSQGLSLSALGVRDKTGGETAGARDAWRLFASNYYLFQATPSRLWLDHVFYNLFEIDRKFSAKTADYFFDAIGAKLATEDFRPRKILDRYCIDYISTTEGALDTLDHHKKIIADGLGPRIAPTFRPDDVLDPDQPEFSQNLERLGSLSGENTANWHGYLAALRNRRDYFRHHGATATDHGHRTPFTADLPPAKCQRLLDACLMGDASAVERELFRGQMLMEMANMSRDDGMVMQLHPGSHRDHNHTLFERYGPDRGADIPGAVTYVEALKPLLNKHGDDPSFSFIVFTLDETNYARELAPLAGHYPCMRLGPPWWFHDSPEGMLRFRRQVTETAGFYNTAGFNDDTRALFSIPARHDVARRMDCRFLAELVVEGRLSELEAFELIDVLTNKLARKAYKLDDSRNSQLSAAN